MSRFRILLIATGGTLAKVYNAHTGALELDNATVDALAGALKQPDMTLDIRHLMARDSLDMTAAERQTIADAVAGNRDSADAVVITHGTDTLSQTAALLAEQQTARDKPVILTGAMVPASCHDSDAFQNLAQAMLACRVLAPGIHVVFHGRVLDGASVAKNRDTLTFETGAR